MRLSGSAPLLCAASLFAGEARLDVPFVRQEKKGCAAASAAMVLSYWAARQPGLSLPNPAPKEIHRQLSIDGAAGVPLAELKRYFEKQGFHSFTLRAERADLEEQLSKGRPLIARLQTSPKADAHYAVVVGLDEKRVWLNDPAKRKPGSMDLSQFEKRWELAGRWILLAVPQPKQAE